MNTINIDLESCNSCKTCVRACFVNVLGWNQSKKQPEVAHAEDCVHCNLCELNCPRHCITVIPDFTHIHCVVL